MDLNEAFIAGLAVNETAVVEAVAKELAIQARQVRAVIDLVLEGCTVPFIARYRKENHGSLDEVQVRDCERRFNALKNLEERRIEVARGIFAQGKLGEELFLNIAKAKTISELDDLYAPYKKKRKTRGMLAQEKGLEPLAELMLVLEDAALEAKAPEYVRDDAEHPELCVKDAAEALQGAMDILAERVSQNIDLRAVVKSFCFGEGKMNCTGVGDEAKKAASVYQMYWEYSTTLPRLKPHHVLAINRGEREGELEAKIEVDEDRAARIVSERYAFQNAYHPRAVEDGLRRLLLPAVLREIRSDATEKADAHGIGVFSANLRNLLMQPPIKGTRVLGIDPGIRTGTKCAALDETGKLLGYFLIRQDKAEDSKKAVLEAIRKHDLKLVAVGNGTGSQEVRVVVAELIAESAPEILYTVVDEDGASVYSASDIAREEFPELDLTVRGAISIGRRLQDPLAELVKIDPKSIGVGLYQHDVNQRLLSETLDEVVGSVVNKVGVNLNTASAALLHYVSGITGSTAKKIVKYRDERGRISSRLELSKVPGVGPKTFEQCAGFLKIAESADLLDNTWVHPENYPLGREILPVVRSGQSIPVETRRELKERYAVGDATLDDIIQELRKPNRDPREDYPAPMLQKDVLKFEDLRVGMMIDGKVKNVVDFGAFVDLGLKESALLHISQMADHFVDDPMEVLKVGDVRRFRIVSLDEARRRIGVSLKKEDAATKDQSASKDAREAPADSSPRNKEGKRGGAEPSARPASAQRDRPRGRSEKDDDGTTYNPFAELFRKK